MVSLRAFDCSFAWHKGFYNTDDPHKALLDIEYKKYFPLMSSDDFPYEFADVLLRGSCNIFAMSLKKIFDYTPYIIEGKDERGFHAFCQIYNKGVWYYIDARGITTSFDEFLNEVRHFVFDEFVIRPITSEDTKKWSESDSYSKHAYAFAEALINDYKTYYSMRDDEYIALPHT